MPADIFRISGETEDLYQEWREKKLSRRPEQISEFIKEIKNPGRLTEPEKESLLESVRNCGFAVYFSGSGKAVSKNDLLNLGLSFGLKTLDSNHFADDEGFSAITVSSGKRKGEYIPYTDKAIHWHTDGYYNTKEHQVRSLLLHCETQAAEGGENRLADYELIYIKIRDRNPEYIKALQDPEAFTIPAHTDADGKILREEISVPVFETDADGSLYMRFTQRTRNIHWKENTVLKEALHYLNSLLESETDIWKLRLEPGMGLICNNVLHDRSAFRDDPSLPGRLMYRLRYYERI